MRQRRLQALAAMLGLTALAACGDSRLNNLTLGMASDSVSTIIGQPPHRSMTYLTAGKHWGLQLFPRSSTDLKDSVVWRKLSPVVTIDGKVVGWGWKWWSHEAAVQHVDMPKD